MECEGGYEKEQFRATRTWNTIVTAVQEELPVGRHRKGLKHIENCFSGNEAVSWTLHYLKENWDILFGAVDDEKKCKKPTDRTEITRQKVALLLQKFVEQKIIEDVHGRGQQFKDSSHQLYTFKKHNASIEDDSYIRESRGGNLSYVPPRTTRSATSLVKMALVSVSIQKIKPTGKTT
ncbi:DEP domain-containing protein 1A-like [Varroa jacobsoni]|uniref:DEP domain-containing protein 1A-like n=1 Tax=Varroa jacobsoni TaxID=62625 RepID=UPI000BF9AAD7|nr:DEP domain-containing protein 1A-like [Varroa jacobsoni]